MRATIISIGNELLNGRTVNSNATFISGRLFEIGIQTERILTIRDKPGSITEGLQTALAKTGLVIITGGLGPTHDDITKKVIADYFHSRLVFDESVMRSIEQKFRERGLQMPAVNRNQAYVPDRATPLPNPAGVAPGLHFALDDKHVFVMPGVPREMEAIMTRSVIPWLKTHVAAEVPEVHLFRTTRIAESRIFEKCQDFLPDFSGYEIAFLPKFTGVDIRVIIPPAARQAHDFQQFESALYERIGKYIYTTADEELTAVVGRLLQERGLTLAVAESCSGGLLQHLITAVPGSSAYFWGGMVTYSNESKQTFLGVKTASLEKFGAVSEVVAKEMAAGVRKALGTDTALSTTGIAGPGGGTPEKPVGLVFIGLAIGDAVQAKQFNLGKDRTINKEQTAQFALDMLRRALCGLPL